MLKTRIKQLETLTSVEVKRVRHDGAKEYVTKDFKAWYDDKGITPELTAPYKAQQNGKAERVNRTLLERIRAAMLEAGAKEELWAEALAAVFHVLNRSPKAGLGMTPLEALTGRRPNVAGFRVWGSRAWALKPKTQQRKLEPRTDVGRFVGYAVGGKAYRVLKDGSDQVIERRDVLMEENPAVGVKNASTAASSAGPQLTARSDGDNNADEDGAIDFLDGEGGSGDEYVPDLKSDSDDKDGSPHSPSGSRDDDDGNNRSTL